MKENYILATQNRGFSPPSPAVLLSPAVTDTSVPSLNAQKRAESYLDSPSVHTTNSAFSITDSSPCSFTRPVRPFNLETIAEEHGSSSLVASPELCQNATEFATLPFAEIVDQEIAGSYLDTTTSDSILVSASPGIIPASASLKSGISEPLLDSTADHELFVHLPPCENSTVNQTADVSYPPHVRESEEFGDMSSNVDRELPVHLSTNENPVMDQATDYHPDVRASENSCDLNFTDNDIGLKTFNYCVNLPKVTGSAVLDSIDHLLINFAGNYQSNLFIDEFSVLIVKHFKLNIDLSAVSEQKFNNLKMLSREPLPLITAQCQTGGLSY